MDHRFSVCFIFLNCIFYHTVFVYRILCVFPIVFLYIYRYIVSVYGFCVVVRVFLSDGNFLHRDGIVLKISIRFQFWSILAYRMEFAQIPVLRLSCRICGFWRGFAPMYRFYTKNYFLFSSPVLYYSCKIRCETTVKQVSRNEVGYDENRIFSPMPAGTQGVSRIH